MRLLMTTDTVGGVWTFTSVLAAELLARRHDVALVSFGRAPSKEQRQWARDLTVRFPNFIFAASEAPLEWMPQNDSAYTLAKPVLQDLCDSFQPDALLLSQFCFGSLPVDQPKLVIAHSDVLSWATAVGKAPLADDAWLRTYRSLVQRGLDGADAVIAPTRAMLHDLRANFALPHHTEVIANGRTLPLLKDGPKRKLQAVTAGRMWDAAKNLRLLTECSSPMQILVAGDDHGTDVSSSNVWMLGTLSEERLLETFKASAIYICSSVYEPFGLAPLEAALCGCAVLANDIPTLREVWGDAALYFNNAASLSALLARLAASPTDLAATQRRSHARAQTYTSARMAEQYLRLIESVTANTAAGEANAA